MSFRTAAPLAAVTLLALAADNPAAAQPAVPNRPRSSPFLGLFGPGSSAAPNFGPGMRGQATGPAGRAANGLTAEQSLALDALVRTYSGQPVTFNNLGHWYSGSYGHWYPNGITNGAGVLGGAGFGGRGGGLGGGAGSVRGGSGGVPRTPTPAIGIAVPFGR